MQANLLLHVVNKSESCSAGVPFWAKKRKRKKEMKMMQKGERDEATLDGEAKRRAVRFDDAVEF